MTLRAMLMAGAAVAVITGSANAADIYMPAPDVPVVLPDHKAFDWSGVYIGVVGGGGLFSVSGPSNEYGTYYGTYDLSQWSWLGGFTAGANVQSGSAVFGIEGDISLGGMEVNGSTYYDPAYYELKSKWNWLATIRARAGVSVGHALLYATGGVAIADTDYAWCYNTGACGAGTYSGYYDFASSGVKVGLAAGVGAEYALSNNMTLKGEYLFVGMPSSSMVYSDYTYGAQFTSSAHLLRVGLNLHF